jgi:uncharacterized protein
MGADALIARFGLEPHPEGGWYRRLHCSSVRVSVARGARAAVTTILYLLRAGELSRWHRVRSDEVWHFYAGAPLELLRADPQLSAVETVTIGPPDSALPVAVVAADHWQAARSHGDYSLLGCTVAPGFEFADFKLLADEPALAAALRARHPQYTAWL